MDGKSDGNTSHLIKELEQERILLEEENKLFQETITSVEQENKSLVQNNALNSHKCRELEQQNLALEEIAELHQKPHKAITSKHYLVMALVPIMVVLVFLSLTYDQEHGSSSLNYNSNYVIQNLQGDTVDTWVAWNIKSDRVIHVHVVNEAKVSQEMINAVQDAILSTKSVSVDGSQAGRDSQGTSSTYYAGWEGADAQAYSVPTKSYVPQKFDIDGSPNGVGDIEIILTNDVNPDGYSGYTKSLVDGNEILKSKITIFKADRLDADRLGAIVRHEFGHALGLGHSTASDDLMHPMLPDYPYISGCDVDALKELYDGDKNSNVVCKK